ncbi:MAG: DUF5916 domain-containing protein [Cytophagales bacterium]|nr:carbohydrate binding family 9 domain-containing protein [Bernardetiaceae bacterium]MDW8211579.1 DUF5916 domain-containing protein [Cytophagales bacterium]
MRRKIIAVPAAIPPKIDGYLNDLPWLTAPSVSNFVQVEPFQGQKVNFDTQVKALYDHRFLYIGAFCRDSGGKKALRAPDLRRDFDYQAHDLFGIAIDGFYDKRNAMVLITNPYGCQRDLLSFDDQLFDTEWDGRWIVRTQRLDSGWTAEFAIPWQTLRYKKPSGGQVTWGINFFRTRRATNEQSAWSPYPRAFSPLRMDYAGELVGIQPPPPSTNIQLIPYALQTLNYQADGPSGLIPISLKAGGEMKWATSSHSVLDVTFNTDFAQADVDRQVNNLSRFSVFFPERRQFFLENASLFGIGLTPDEDSEQGTLRIQPFFSRRIGLDDQGNPLPLAAGARYVYRSEKKNYGGMLMRQRGTPDHAPVTYAIGRYSHNFGTQNRLGSIVTYRHEEALNGQAASYNAVVATDVFTRFSQSLNLNAMAMKSLDSNPASKGWAGFAQFRYDANNLVAWLTGSVITKRFNPKVGFVSRQNVVAITPGGFLIIRKPWMPKGMRGFEPGVFSEIYFNAHTGALQEARLSLNPIWLDFQTGGFFGVFIDPTFQRIEETFSPLGIDISPGNYHYWQFSAMAGSDRSKKVSYFAYLAAGGYYNGSLLTLEGNLRFAPIPYFQFNFSYQNNVFSGVGVEKKNIAVQLWSMESRLAFHPRLQLMGFYQFNALAQRGVWNVRLSWEFQPLSFVYLVFNQRSFEDDVGQRRTSRHLIGKISYLKQF